MQIIFVLSIAVRPFVSLDPGPLHVIEGRNVTLPTCHVTGHPAPVIRWRKSLGQLPQGRVQSNNSVLQLLNVRKADSDSYICTATNLLGSAVQKTLLVVVSPPRFTRTPPSRVVGWMGGDLTLNCSATGDPQPTISWKRQGGSLPSGRTQQINGDLVISNIRYEDAGSYICVARSAGVSAVEAMAYVRIPSRGELRMDHISTNFNQ